MKRVRKQILFFICIISLISCKKEVREGWDDTLSTGLVRIACDENFKALMDSEIRVFEARNPGATILPVYTTEVEAIRLLTQDSVRFALVTRDLTVKEQQQLKEHALKSQKHIIGFEGIALISNKSNENTEISLSDLRKIIKGELTEWSQINPKSSLGTIRVLFENKESGVLRYIADSVAQQKKLTSSNLYALNDHSEVVEKVLQMPNALGIISANELNNSVQLVSIDGYLPYAGDIMQENYPLWRPVYVLLTDPKSGLPSGLSIFLAREIGQMILMKFGLLPVTDPQNRDVMIKDEYPN
ncbi:phosphate ABC transporter substrate-binding protein [Bacteroidia bacterium]|nr:phosphate ABC transporter substrate-binding protein [Bacteroidia bacterium]